MKKIGPIELSASGVLVKIDAVEIDDEDGMWITGAEREERFIEDLRFGVRDALREVLPKDADGEPVKLEVKIVK